MMVHQASRLSYNCHPGQSGRESYLGKKYMSVSDHMGLQNRVGRSGIFFFAIFCYCPQDKSEILENY